MMARIADTRTPFVRWYGFQLLMASWLLLGSLGCERRNFYRDQADQEVNCIIQQTTDDPKYALAHSNLGALLDWYRNECTCSN